MVLHCNCGNPACRNAVSIEKTVGGVEMHIRHEKFQSTLEKMGIVSEIGFDLLIYIDEADLKQLAKEYE